MTSTRRQPAFLRFCLMVATTGTLSGCASEWKIHGGPQECVQMCHNWGLVFAGMVGVGNQDRTGEGATACVCQVPSKQDPTAGGSAAAAASLAAPITAAEAAAAAALAQQRQVAAAQAAAAHTPH